MGQSLMGTFEPRRILKNLGMGYGFSHNAKAFSA
jgi:hypothetical protein